MRIAGENGIAAYGVIMYVSFIFCAMFIGYSVGCAPLIGYNYGAENYPELKNLFHKSLKLVAAPVLPGYPGKPSVCTAGLPFCRI